MPETSFPKSLKIFLRTAENLRMPETSFQMSEKFSGYLKHHSQKV
jgi:hypothetical protein